LNRVTVIIEADHGEQGAHRTEVSAVFDSPHHAIPDVLSVFENALRGAGFAVDIEGLTTTARHDCEAWRTEGLGCQRCNGRVP
jgi:hypothetical protein